MKGKIVFVFSVLYLVYSLISLYHAMITDTQERIMTSKKEPSVIQDSLKLLKPPAGWKKTLIDKNIFSPSRGYTVAVKKQEPPSPPVEPTPSPPEIVLKGIVYNQFGEYIAIIQVDKKILKVKEGEVFGDLTVKRIDDRSVSLRFRDIPIELTFKKAETLL